MSRIDLITGSRGRGGGGAKEFGIDVKEKKGKKGMKWNEIKLSPQQPRFQTVRVFMWNSLRMLNRLSAVVFVFVKL